MKHYKISKARLEQLLVAEARLMALEFGGVDNWEWYGDSISDHYSEPVIGETEKFEEVT